MEQKPARKSAEVYWATSCYIPIANVITSVLTLVRMADSKFCRSNVRQGLVMFGLSLVSIFLGLFSPNLSRMMWGVTLFLHGLAAYYTYNLSDSKIPFVTDWSAKIDDKALLEFLTGKAEKKDSSRTDSNSSSEVSTSADLEEGSVVGSDAEVVADSVQSESSMDDSQNTET